jgi:glycosyltransferase involved in cell wall biosynthesis
VSFPAGAVAMQLSRESGTPYLVTEHMSPFPFVHLVRGGQVVPEVSEPLRHAARVTAVSRSLARELRERVGVQAAVVPNGIDGGYFSPPAGPPAQERDFTFLTVANLTPQKGIDDLLAAIARLAPATRAVFRIAGAGSHAAAYRALAERLGVTRRVTWLGALGRDAVRDELRACDAFVLASRHESFGVVYAEAIACGRPVLATRCGGPEDIVDGTNGELVPVGDVPALAAALERFAARSRAWDTAAIRAGFEARFSAAAVARRFGELYAEVAGAAR